MVCTWHFFSATGPMVASVSAGWEAIPRANTRSARTIPVPNTGQPAFSHILSQEPGWNICLSSERMMWFFPQLIQDEIKALVQLQNRQASVQPHTEFSPTAMTKTTTNTKDYIFPLLSSDSTVSRNVTSDNDFLAAPVHTPFSSPSPPLQRSETANQGEERATTVLSSGYGTLSAWDTGLEHVGSPGEDDDQGREKQNWPSNLQEDPETTVIGCQQDFSNETTLGLEEPYPPVYQQRTSGYVWVVYQTH